MPGVEEPAVWRMILEGAHAEGVTRARRGSGCTPTLCLAPVAAVGAAVGNQGNVLNLFQRHGLLDLRGRRGENA